MGFPSKDSAPDKAYLLARAKDTVGNVKQKITSLINKMQTDRMSATNFTAASVALAEIKMELSPIVEVDGMDDHAIKEIGRPVVSDAEFLIEKCNEAQAVIATLLPSDKNGWLQIVRFDADGSLAWRNYSPEEMESVRLKLQEVADSIE